MTLRYHDVSHYEANYQPIGPTAAKCTEGTSFVDPEFTAIRGRAHAAGRPFIAYHFLHRGDIGAQVDHVIATIGPGLPLMLDVETPPSGTPPMMDDLTEFVRLYGERADGGRVTLAYVPHWYWVGHMGSPDLRPLTGAGVGLISSSYQAYSTDGPGWTPYGGVRPVIWQYTSTPIDTNAFEGTEAELAALFEGDDDPMAALTKQDIQDAFAAALTDPATVKAFAAALMAADVVPAIPGGDPDANADAATNDHWSLGYLAMTGERTAREIRDNTAPKPVG